MFSLNWQLFHDFRIRVQLTPFNPLRGTALPMSTSYFAFLAVNSQSRHQEITASSGV